ncbi:dihydroorotase [Candidatus Omnitrophota bacterium]
MKLLIKGGRVVDPANNLDGGCDILVVNGKVARVAKDIQAAGAKVIAAAGKIVIPGLVDMHVHLREPGREDKETVATATTAALKGGVSCVLAMPNTNPALDSSATISLLKRIIKTSAKTEVLICAAITKDRAGKELTPLAQFRPKGVVAISDDGSSVDSDNLLLEAFKQAKQNKMLVICHSEDKALAKSGVVNLGIVSTRMGLKGISAESEYRRVERDLRLAKQARAAVHIAHVSCAESVKIIARAKKSGQPVTCETAPHYFALTDQAVTGFDTNMKVNPPLRSQRDVDAIKQGLKDGTIDAIASDHAPHTENEKDIEFDRAAFGSIGLETILAVSITELIETGLLNWRDLVEKIALNPARILKVDRGSLAVGQRADIVVVDPQKQWQVEREDFLSKSKNSAFLGRKLKGIVEYTIIKGSPAYDVHC